MSLHDAIMNLPCKKPAELDKVSLAFLMLGHRDARHAAAELALPYDAVVEAARDLLLEASCDDRCRRRTVNGVEGCECGLIETKNRLRAALEAL